MELCSVDGDVADSSFASRIVGNLTSKLGGIGSIGESKASGIASLLVSVVLNFIKNKISSGDSEGGLMDMLGGESGRMMDMSKDLLGKKLGGMFS